MRAVRSADVIIAELESARAEVMAAASGLSDEELSKLGQDGWSIRDHLAHLCALDELRYFEIGRIARGGRAALRGVSDEEFDRLNGITAEPRRAMAIEQVLEDMEFARALVLDAVSHAPEEALDEGRYGDLELYGAAEHDRAHAEAIREIRRKEGI